MRFVLSLFFVAVGFATLFVSFSSLSVLTESYNAIGVLISGMALGGLEAPGEINQAGVLKRFMQLQYPTMLAGFASVAIGALSFFKVGLLRRFYWVPTLVLLFVGAGYASIGETPSGDDEYLSAIDTTFGGFAILFAIHVLLLLLAAVFAWRTSRQDKNGTIADVT